MSLSDFGNFASNGFILLMNNFRRSLYIDTEPELLVRSLTRTADVARLSYGGKLPTSGAAIVSGTTSPSRMISGFVALQPRLA